VTTFVICAKNAQTKIRLREKRANENPFARFSRKWNFSGKKINY